MLLNKGPIHCGRQVTIGGIPFTSMFDHLNGKRRSRKMGLASVLLK
jgi:hypothetical protein